MMAISHTEEVGTHRECTDRCPQLRPQHMLPRTPGQRPMLLSHGSMVQRLPPKLEAHRRWNVSMPLGFLCSVDRVDIRETVRNPVTNTVVYVLEASLSLPRSRLPTAHRDHFTASSRAGRRRATSRPMYTVERRFSDFEGLRESVLDYVSGALRCACHYCKNFRAYIRYRWHQPRGIIKLIAATWPRKQILAAFVNDFVDMGRRCTQGPTVVDHTCATQKRVPELLAAFLLDGAIF